MAMKLGFIRLANMPIWSLNRQFGPGITKVLVPSDSSHGTDCQVTRLGL
ncbi:hypothetical protein LINPERHAP1_LOCUS5113 [Linum perenne]